MRICTRCKDHNKPVKTIKCELQTAMDSNAWGYTQGGFTEDLCLECKELLRHCLEAFIHNNSFTVNVEKRT